ncbi:MAG: DEAD/DEAH box helicase [Candidatus Izemoplasmatales bacterium]|nr:DEAD/DEAH box helicase [Candidatus Izemoplasmatales bacterium]
MTFNDLNLIEPILRAIEKEGYTEPTPIQEEAIPVLLDGKDVLGSAQTGTGKTAAFAIPILQVLNKQGQTQNRKKIQSLILTPTRELAMQIKESFRAYGQFLSLKTVVIFGGVSQKSQVQAMARGVDILVATPGRLLDLINQKIIDISQVKFLVLDEADRMLDMGFIKDVQKIIAFVPKERQTMLFSATMPADIQKLANAVLRNPVRIAITPVETTVEAITQSLYYVSRKNKTNLLLKILENKNYTSVLVFSRTKHGANKIAKDLRIAHIPTLEIHGNKSQGARTEALYQFKSNQVRVLVATDIAARGLDIEGLSLVVQYDLPDVPETYIHRIGRTGRAGLDGIAIAFCQQEEFSLLKAIHKHLKMQIPLVTDQPYHDAIVGLDMPSSVSKAPVQKPKNFSKFDTRNKSKHEYHSSKTNRFN